MTVRPEDTRRIRFPDSYRERMQALLGEEYAAFAASMERPVYNGLRVNTLKISMEDFRKRWEAFADAEAVDWCPEGLYIPEGLQPSKDPDYAAGLYYLQEPSAMSPAAILPVEPGDRVLDLCAAPGGKSTQLLCKLQGQGLLVSNDISPSRAKALLKNLELFGGRNYVVTTEAPYKLAERFQGFFTKILVDAPCSGEGMFHKEPAIIKNWEQYGNGYYAALQKEILEHAAGMLAPGGQMVYSTCTFAPMEDEESIQNFLNDHPEFHLVPIPKTESMDNGHPEWITNGSETLTYCARLWPHRILGEGHFVALLEKDGEMALSVENSGTDSMPETLVEWEKLALTQPLADFLPIDGHFRTVGDYLVYELLPADRFKGLRTLRSGLLLGELKKNRFEPSQALAMALPLSAARFPLNLRRDDPDLIRYLKGETLSGEFPKEWMLVEVDGYPVGWAKGTGNLLKNKYLKGWRLL